MAALPFAFLSRILHGPVKYNICEFYQSGFSWRKTEPPPANFSKKQAGVYKVIERAGGGSRWDLQECSRAPPPDSNMLECSL